LQGLGYLFQYALLKFNCAQVGDWLEAVVLERVAMDLRLCGIDRRASGAKAARFGCIFFAGMNAAASTKATARADAGLSTHYPAT
jgi:hypothetical protein